MKTVLILTVTVVILSVTSTEAQTVGSPRLDLFQSSSNARSSFNPIPFDENISSGKKKVGLAVLYSLLLPGMGELYVEEYGVGKYFTIAEGVLWLTYSSFELYGTWLRDDARNFAVTHARIAIDGKDDQYFVDIGNFLNIYDYNEKKLRDREPEKLYDVNTHFWQWEYDAHRAAYRELRISHDHVFNNNRFVVAAIIVNHIASAINAGRLALSHNRRLEEASLIQVHASVLGGARYPHGIMISVSKTF